MFTFKNHQMGLLFTIKVKYKSLRINLFKVHVWEMYIRIWFRYFMFQRVQLAISQHWLIRPVITWINVGRDAWRPMASLSHIDFTTLASIKLMLADRKSNCCINHMKCYWHIYVSLCLDYSCFCADVEILFIYIYLYMFFLNMFTNPVWSM